MSNDLAGASPVDQPVRRVVDARTLATHREIADAVRCIEKERRDAMRELMRDFDHGYYYPNLKDMREACGRLGHKWRFTHFGPLSDPWFSCGVCHASECRPERESDYVPLPAAAVGSRLEVRVRAHKYRLRDVSR